MTDVEALQRALDYPWEKWTIFLHPAQSNVVERNFNGPARVSGSAGTVIIVMAIFGPNQHPEQIIETKRTLTMANLDGETADYDWVDGPPLDVLAPEGKSIQLVNYFAEYDPFTIAEIAGSGVFSGELTPYAVFPTWNHWPVAQMPSDGRNASFPDWLAD